MTYIDVGHLEVGPKTPLRCGWQKKGNFRVRVVQELRGEANEIGPQKGITRGWAAHSRFVAQLSSPGGSNGTKIRHQNGSTIDLNCPCGRAALEQDRRDPRAHWLVVESRRH